MSGQSHTGGPWRVCPARDGSGDIGIKAVSPTNIHAEVFAEFWAKGDFRREEAEANARLIAAAPDLLEATKAALEWIGWYFDADASARTGPTSEEVKALARAAIAKAEGR